MPRYEDDRRAVEGAASRARSVAAIVFKAASPPDAGQCDGADL